MKAQKKAETKTETMKKQAEAKETRRRKENAKKAKEAAEQLFPGEKWMAEEDGIYLSPHRPTGEKTNYKAEKRDAQILRDLGSTVYFTPENRGDPGKKYDAIVDGLKFEFKNIHGVSTITLKDHFLRSRQQAPNVFLNLEDSLLTRGKIMGALYAARNSEDYQKKNAFEGGRIILKIKGHNSLIYLNVDDLKVPGR